MAKNFWEADAPADDGNFWSADRQAAQQDLPADVKPSTAGAGRGSMAPSAYARPEPAPVDMGADAMSPEFGGPQVVPAEPRVSVLQDQPMEVPDPARRLSMGAGPITQQTAAHAERLVDGQDPGATNRPVVERAARGLRTQVDAGQRDTFGQQVQRANDPTTVRTARDQTAEQFRSIGEWALDSSTALASGAVSLAQMVPNIVAPDSALSATLAKAQTGLQDMESAPMQARKQQLAERVKSEDGFLDQYLATVSELVTNPSVAIQESLRQAAMFAGVIGAAKLGGAAAGGAVGAAERASPTVALAEAISGGTMRTAAQAGGQTAGGVAAASTMAAGDAAGATYEKLMAAPDAMWAKNPDFAELVGQGVPPEQAKAEIATSKARLAALMAAPLGVLGFMGAEASFAGRAGASAGRPVRTLATEMVTEPTEEALTTMAGNAAVQTVDAEQAITEGAGQAAGTATVTSGPFGAAAAVNEMRARPPVDRSEQIKALRSAGDKTAADLLQRRQDRETAAWTTERETEALQTFGPAVQQRYRESRAAGAMPGDAVTQTAMRTTFEQAADAAGLSEKAREAALAKAATMPPDKAPGFLQKALQVFTAKGLAQPIEGADALATAIESRRDELLDAVLAADIRPTMAAIEDLEQGAPVAPEAAPVAETPEIVSREAEDFGGNDVLVTPETDAVHQAATSPLNDLPEPTQAQKEAGNYKLGRVRIGGMDIAVENPQGSVRRGTAPDGTPWETPMRDHYGYFNGTTAADGDKLDVFIKPGTAPDFGGTVFVVDQVDPDTGKFDEAKVIFGATDQADAEAIYARNYRPDWKGLGAITALPMPAFKAWATSQQTRKPLGVLPTRTDAQISPPPAATGEAGADQAPPAAGSAAAQPAAGVPAAGDATAVEADGVDAAPGLATADEQRSASAEADRKRSEKRARLTSNAWAQNPLRAFLGKHGISSSLANEFAPGAAERRKAMVPGYGPIFRKAGKNIDMLAEAAREAGFIQGEDVAELHELIARVFRGEKVIPLFAEGAAEQEMESRQAALEEDARAQFEDYADADPFAPDDQALLEEVGYDAADAAVQAEFRALIAAAEAEGIDTETLLEDAHYATRDDSNDQYRHRATADLENARSQRRETPGRARAGQGREAAEPNGHEHGGAVPGPQGAQGPQRHADGDGKSNGGVTTTLRADGTLAVKGDTPTIRKLLADAGITNVLPMRGGVLVGKSSVKQAQALFDEPVLTAPTRADIEAQQDRTTTADTTDQRDQVRRESEAGAGMFELSREDGRQDTTGSLFANEPTPEYTALYETDLFGNPLPAKPGNAAAGRRSGTGARLVQPAATVSGDTTTPDADYFIRTVVGREQSRKLGADRILTPQDAAQATSYLYRSAVEQFDAIVTDKAGKPLAVVGGFKGAVSQASVYGSTIMAEAVRVPGAAKIWFSHNHPSGSASLSEADKHLNANLSEMFRGTGIDSMGILAVAGEQYAHQEPPGSFGPEYPSRGMIPAPADGVTVPVIERELGPKGEEQMLLDSPQEARVYAAAAYKRSGPGVMLLNSQNRVSAWLPLPKYLRGKLRGTGGLAALYRAVSESNASAAIVVHGGELDAPVNAPDSAITQAQNIAAAFSKVDVRALDIINATTGESAAAQGLAVAAGPVFARTGTSDAPSARVLDADLFRRMTTPMQRGMRVADVEQAIAPVLKRWKNGPRVTVVATVRDLPVDAPHDVAGFYTDGHAYLVAANLKDRASALRYLGHEVVAHYGLRELLGDTGFRQFTNQVQLALKTGNKALAAIQAEVRAAYVDKDGKFNLSPHQESDEIAAKVVEQAIDADGNFRPGFGFVKAVYAKIVEFLRSRNFNIAFTHAELQGILVNAQRGLEVGKRTAGARGAPEPVWARSETTTVPAAIVGSNLGAATGHPKYAAAKAGDIDAAVEVARALVTPQLVDQVRKAIGASKPLVVPVVSMEAAGRNKIPRASAELLAQRLDLQAATGIVQANSPKRTAMDGLDRIFASPEFDGPVVPGQDYLILDDTLTQGATFASLAAHIEAGGGRVVAAVALTGKQYSAKIQPSADTLKALRDKHGDLETDFQAATGYGFDALTESEARYIANFKPAQQVRDRIAAEGRRGRERQDQGPAVGLSASTRTGRADAAFIGYLSPDGKFESYTEAEAEAVDFHHSHLVQDLDAYDAEGGLTFVRMGGEPIVSIKGTPAMDPYSAKSVRMIGDLARRIIADGGNPEMPFLIEDMGFKRTEAPYQGKEIGTLADWVARAEAQSDGPAFARTAKSPAAVEAEAAIDRQNPPTTGRPDLFTPGFWETPQDTRTDKFIFEVQDGRIDLKRVQQAIAKVGGEIREQFDARLAETLYPGRVAHRAQQFLEDEAKPLLEVMARNNVPMAELSDYLHARGAEERNAQIAKVNPDLPDGGAGRNSKGVLLTNAAAREYLAAVTPARKMVLDALAKRVDAITSGTRRLLVDEGLEKAETIEAWEKAYQNYVPMFRDEAEEGRPHPTGSGMSVRGSASKRATGSTKEVTNILAHVLMQREAAITRAEKNRVAVALYGMALTNPNPDFWATIRPGMAPEAIGRELQRMGVDPTVAEAGMQGVPTIRTVDPVLGRVVDRPNPIYKSLPGAIVLKVNGEDRVLMINAGDARGQRMAENLKNLDGLTRLDIASSAVGKTTRWLASVNTQYNPAFGLVNLTRDTLGGAINLSSTRLRGKTTKVLAMTPGALRGIALELAGQKSGDWGKLLRQFQADGGQTGYREMFKDANDRTARLQAELKSLEKAGKLTSQKVAGAVLGALDIFNTSLENAVRLAAYKEGLDVGMSRAEAARLGRELTVDFNRKGRTGRELSPLYAFFNAAVQGTARTLETVRGPAGAKIIAGGLSLGVMQALLLLLGGYDEDEIPEFVKSRAFIVPLGKDGEGKKQYFTIPYPLGLHVLPNTGRVLAELTLSGGEDGVAKSLAAVGEIASAFNPLGGGNIFTPDGFLRTVAPSVVDPIIELGANKNFAGAPIERESQGENDPRPGFQRAREATLRTATGQTYTDIARIINTMTGGNAYEKGLASPTPERVRYLAQVVGGGLLREIEKTVNTSIDAAKGQPVKASGVPVLGRFYGEVDDASTQRSRYFDNLREIETLERKIRAAEKAGDTEAATRMEADGAVVDASRSARRAKKGIRELNTEAMETIGDGAALRAIDEERTEVMRELNEDVEAIKQETRGPTPGDRLRRAAGVATP